MNASIQMYEIAQDIQLQKIVTKWQNYINSIDDWQSIIKNIQHRKCACGLVYEISHPLLAENESFAIVDMRNLAFCEPHYHPETEIYFIVQGTGLVVVGGQEHHVQKGSVIEIPSNIAHFTIPEKDLVMAVVNTPPFNPDHYYPLSESNAAAKFDKQQFDRLMK
jgi:mannose-6-phosphate isomerase-like protein (cupin superfamily)